MFVGQAQPGTIRGSLQRSLRSCSWIKEKELSRGKGRGLKGRRKEREERSGKESGKEGGRERAGDSSPVLKLFHHLCSVEH